jgi:hypothetical protein
MLTLQNLLVHLPAVRKGMLSFLQLLRHTPNRIFAYDGFGACLAALFYSVLALNHQKIGISAPTIWSLAAIAIGFGLYSSVSFFVGRSAWRRWLSVLILANSLHLCGVIILVALHAEKMTPLGFLAFANDWIVLGLVIALELWVLRNGNLAD